MQCPLTIDTAKTASTNHHDTNTTMTVDIRLCGNIPRQELQERLFGAPLGLTSHGNSLNTPCLAETNGSLTYNKTDLCDADRHSSNKCGASALTDLIFQNTSNMKHHHQRGVLLEHKQFAPVAPALEPPSWAVPASGESRLEPISEPTGRQLAVDLTSKKAFRIGRSLSCDVQLMHATSSRRHAMLFHHSNGSCYIVDCGSGHGTFVNGKRIPSPANTGVVVPFKVRRGSLIRFGGPGAPTFVLKSFSFRLKDIQEETDTADIVRRNTRLNALGKTATETVRGNLSKIMDEALLSVQRKRSFDSLASNDTLDAVIGMDEQCSSNKRMRCSSPPVSPEEPLRLVSPDLLSVQASKPRHVTFSMEPPQAFYPVLVTPEESSEEDNVA